MFRAKSIMTKYVLTVQEDTDIIEAMRLLIDHNVTGMPVVDCHNNLKGIISEKDMLRMLYEGDKYAKVGELMTRDVVTFGEEAELPDICECLINNNFRRIPIVNEDKLVGIISRKDIIKFILQARQKRV